MRRVGVVSISDERQNANARIAPVIRKQSEALLGLLRDIRGVEPVLVDELINSPSAARKAGKYLASEAVVATIFNLPTFGFPKFGILVSMFLSGPFMLVAQMDSTQPSLAGVAGLGGAMTQLGIPHERLWADFSSPEVKRRLQAFISAGAAVNGLRGMVLGLIGGRSMGLYPMVASSRDYAKLFGVDVDHIDELEVIRRSAEIQEEQVDKALAWLSERAGSIQFDNILTTEKIRNQIKNYEALKTIVKERELDFTAIKCHYEMSEYQQPMCIAAMFSNDPYDWDGDKQPHVLACEADEDGALTMQVLKLVSAGSPTCLLDMRYYDKENRAYLLQNCGAAPSWFARRSSDPEDNLRHVDFCSCVPKFKGGGAQTSFWFGPGEFTLARLHQVGADYHMIIAKGEAVPPSIAAKMPSGEAHWPKVAMKINTTPERMAESMNCVHLHAVEGDYRQELELVCKYLRIVPERIDV